MKNFVQYTPTEVIFGRDTHKQAGEAAKKWGAHRVLLVYGGGSVIKNGTLQAVEQSLEEAGLTYEELGGVKPNPRLSLAREGVKKALEFEADLILAVGGGSSIDTAKAIAIGAANPGKDIWDIFWSGKEKVTQVLPVGVVLTIAAAGSEMSDSAVLTNEETGRKAGLSTDFNRPKFAIMNPELTFTLPKYQVACVIVDIMMHTLERYFTPVGGNQMTDEIAEGLLRTVIANGKIAYEDPENYDAMSEIMWCGSLSHNGITGLGGQKDFLNHKLGHELSARFDEAHGATLSAVWGSWARYVYQIDVERFAHYGRSVWNITEADPEKAAMQAIEATEAFWRSIDMPICLGQMKTGILSDEVLRAMANLATKDDTVLLGTFKKMNAEDMYQIYQMANHE